MILGHNSERVLSHVNHFFYSDFMLLIYFYYFYFVLIPRGFSVRARLGLGSWRTHWYTDVRDIVGEKILWRVLLLLLLLRRMCTLERHNITLHSWGVSRSGRKKFPQYSKNAVSLLNRYFSSAQRLVQRENIFPLLPSKGLALHLRRIVF